ncbi:hypothetical protein BDEG_28082 [Batrachochytrium dendrobatidis JEL423]|uniref:Uncharacterized protein n=1 Tax=Batrachochytrium dendrobatidis (strain JEL423) TaxID=403673 RepID=A0A177WXR3_BATDL|nr:hypothetical protein BDEG_28082 [Batrachochytrium dendrobatidis JEL423]
MENITELNRLQEKAVELQEAFVTYTPNEERIRFRDLQRENQVLSQLVKQYESTLEIIMSKFRSQTHLIQQERQELRDNTDRILDQERTENELLREENTRLTEHLGKCIQVMREASSANDEADVAMLVAGLAKENETLRAMLIASLPNHPSHTTQPLKSTLIDESGIMPLPLRANEATLSN